MDLSSLEKERRTGIYVYCQKFSYRQDLILCFHLNCECRTESTYKEKHKMIKRCDEFWKGLKELYEKEETESAENARE